MFFCIESNIRAERLYEKKNFWGIGTTRFLADTISVARKLFPSAEHYVAIYDKSDASYENYNVFINASEKIPNIKFSGIDASAFTKSQIARQLSALDDKTVVFYLGASKDADGIKYSMEEQANFIVNNTSAPVFSHNANGVGFGFLGGKMVDYEKAGALAAKIVLDIIDGEKYIPFQRIKDGKFIFDYKIIEERKLNLLAFPLDSVFVNIHDQMQKNRRGVLFGMIGVAVSLFIFIAVSLILIISQVKDSYELRRSNLKMEYMLGHDSLTDLPNRFKTQAVFNDIQKSGKNFSLVLFDIDDFKNINDFYSHACGDIVLKTIASRLKSYSAGKDIFVSRFGGDEFLVLYLEKQLNEDSIEIHELRAILKSPINYAESNIHIQSSLGIVNSNDDEMEK